MRKRKKKKTTASSGSGISFRVSNLFEEDLNHLDAATIGLLDEWNFGTTVGLVLKNPNMVVAHTLVTRYVNTGLNTQDTRGLDIYSLGQIIVPLIRAMWKPAYKITCEPEFAEDVMTLAAEMVQMEPTSVDDFRNTAARHGFDWDSVGMRRASEATNMLIERLNAWKGISEEELDATSERLVKGVLSRIDKNYEKIVNYVNSFPSNFGRIEVLKGISAHAQSLLQRTQYQCPIRDMEPDDAFVYTLKSIGEWIRVGMPNPWDDRKRQRSGVRDVSHINFPLTLVMIEPE